LNVRLKKSNWTLFGCGRTIVSQNRFCIIQKNEMESWLSSQTAKMFFSSTEKGAACQQPPVNPLIVLYFSVSFPPTTRRSTSIVDGFCSSQDSRGDDPARQYSTPINLSTAFGRRQCTGQTQGSCSFGVRPTLTFENLGTNKPTTY
jgi:hypothetical protein